MKKNFILFAIIIFVSVSANAQFKFIESTTEDVNKKVESIKEKKLNGSNRYIELNKLGVKKVLEDNDFLAASSLFKQAINENPNCFTCLYNLGRAYQKLGRLDEAIALFKKTIKAKSNLTDSYANLGEIYHEKKRFKESLTLFEKAIKLSPKDALLYNNYATVLDQLGEYKKALKHFNKAIRLKSNFAESYANKSVTLYKLKRYKESYKTLKKAYDILKNDARIHNSLGAVLDKLGKKDLAHKHYLEAIHLNPDLDETRFNLGLHYLERGMRVEANQQVKILEKTNFELARRLRKVLWNKYVLDVSDVKKK